MKNKEAALARLQIIEDEAKALRAEIEAPEQKYYKGQYGTFSDKPGGEFDSPVHEMLRGIASDGRFLGDIVKWRYFWPIELADIKLRDNEYVCVTKEPEWL